MGEKTVEIKPIISRVARSSSLLNSFRIILQKIIYGLTQDRLQAFYFTFGLAGLYSAAAFYLDFYAFGDAFAFACMTAALYFHCHKKQRKRIGSRSGMIAL